MRNDTNENDELWKEIKLAWKYYLKPTRKSIGMTWQYPNYPFLMMGRYMDDVS